MAQKAQSSVEIEAPVKKVYDYWETLENLPYFMSNIDEVSPIEEGKTHWKVRGPFGTKLEWDAETTQKEENSLISWRAIEGDVGTSGQVRFQEAGENRTRVEVEMEYSDPPGGRLGEVAARAVADPQLMLDQDLENLRDIMEDRAAPEDVQQRPSAASAQSIGAFLTSGTGLALIGGTILFAILRRRRKSSGGSQIQVHLTYRF